MAGSISTLGVGSGLDLNDIIDQLRAVDTKVIDLKQAKITTLEAQLEEFTVVKNSLLDMKSQALNLSLTGSYLQRSISSSDEDVASVQVTDGATVQNFPLVVTDLASKSSWLSAGLTATTDSVNSQGSDQAFSYKVGTDSIAVIVPDGTTLSGLVDLINNDENNPGVTASVINDGDPATPYRLFLQADDTGEDNRIEALAWLPDLAMTEQEGAAADSLNAQFKIDGIDYQRQSNSFSDAVTGVTLTLNGIGSSTVSIVSNDDAVLASITGLVTSYNEVVQEIRSNTAYDNETESFGILARTSLRSMPFDLQNLMTTTFARNENLITHTYNDADGSVTTTDKNIYSLFDLGLEFNSDGTITIDQDKLKSAWADKSEGVKALFLGDEEGKVTGLAEQINDRLRAYTVGTGQIEAEKTAAQGRITDLELRIETETARLNKRYELLTQQFIGLDRYMNQMTSISNFLTSQFDSISNALSGNGGK
ncbi:MAG: flagellar filament capping protein FliD [Proteobacteria bacterium]|nr:flagellar filament capping protein FliD [Pseudomonadota bacterium]MBU1715785.1 flagellar filament capping protein FliD [Pseudomonadota bacterium]